MCSLSYCIGCFSEEYYEGPMRQVDQLVDQAKQAMLYEITWAEDFRVGFLIYLQILRLVKDF